MIEVLQILEHSSWGFALVVVFGLIWGSFFNVCIYRIPLEQEVVKTPSHCVHCNKTIPWWCNIPVFSYILIRGKCIHCKGGISIQYPLVEATNALLWVWLFAHFGFSWLFVGYVVFVSNLLIISVIDIHHRIIPDELSLGGIVVGFLAVFVMKHIGWQDSLFGILLGGGMFWGIAAAYEKITKREGLGGGDVKLLGMIGAWLGVKAILPIIILSSGLGSIVGIMVLLQKKGDMKTAIPFGPFLALAALVYVFWSDFINSYIFPTLT